VIGSGNVATAAGGPTASPSIATAGANSGVALLAIVPPDERPGLPPASVVTRTKKG
jgi:hypothetical protein